MTFMFVVGSLLLYIVRVCPISKNQNVSIQSIHTVPVQRACRILQSVKELCALMSSLKHEIDREKYNKQFQSIRFGQQILISNEFLIY